MQKSSRTCMLTDHYSKAIEYVCVYPECQLSRFLCPKCLLGTNHSHKLQGNSHILDDRDFYEKIKNNLNQIKGKQQQKKYNVQKLIVPIQQLIQEIQNLLKNVQNITQQVELYNININHLENHLLSVQKYGFNQIDDQLLNNLLTIPDQQQDLTVYKQLEDSSNLIIQNVLKIKEWRLFQVVNNHKSKTQKIKEAKYQIQLIDKTVDNNYINTGAISNDLKQIVSGGEDRLLKIWDYQTNKLIKSIKLNESVYSCKFTQDSTLLYAGSHKYIYLYDVNNQFKELYKQEIHSDYINNIYCMSNTTILTASDDKTIIKTDVTHDDNVYGLDYNKSRNIIASGSKDYQSIKLWNGNDGSLILKKLNAHKFEIRQVLFIIGNNQLISIDYGSKLIKWNINYQTKQLEQLLLIQDSGYNISLVLQQQYIIGTGKKFIKIYSIKGDFVRQFEHEVDYFLFFNILQLDSIRAILILGAHKLKVCILDMD